MNNGQPPNTKKVNGSTLINSLAPPTQPRFGGLPYALKDKGALHFDLNKSCDKSCKRQASPNFLPKREASGNAISTKNLPSLIVQSPELST